MIFLRFWKGAHQGHYKWIKIALPIALSIDSRHQISSLIKSEITSSVNPGALLTLVNLQSPRRQLLNSFSGLTQCQECPCFLGTIDLLVYFRSTLQSDHVIMQQFGFSLFDLELALSVDLSLYRY